MLSDPKPKEKIFHFTLVSYMSNVLNSLKISTEEKKLDLKMYTQVKNHFCKIFRFDFLKFVCY